MREPCLRPAQPGVPMPSCGWGATSKTQSFIGLYLNPPVRALALCAGGESRENAGTLTVLATAIPLATAEWHGSCRAFAGTSSMFAVLDAKLGTGIAPPRSPNAEFCRFLGRLDRSVDAGLGIHLIV